MDAKEKKSKLDRMVDRIVDANEAFYRTVDHHEKSVRAYFWQLQAAKKELSELKKDKRLAKGKSAREVAQKKVDAAEQEMWLIEAKLARAVEMADEKLSAIQPLIKRLEDATRTNSTLRR